MKLQHNCRNSATEPLSLAPTILKTSCLRYGHHCQVCSVIAGQLVYCLPDVAAHVLTLLLLPL